MIANEAPIGHGARVGWIGFGNMGRPMCQNLLKAGYRADVYNRNAARHAAIRAVGASPAASPAELAASCGVIISMIWDDASLHEIVFGANGLLSAARPGTIYVDMSTVSPAASACVGAALAESGIAYLRASVSGSESVAEAGDLAIFVSGPANTYAHCRPLFDVLGSQHTYVGAGEEARVIKLAINMLVQTSSAVLGEALSFGERAGVDRALLMDAINDSIVGSQHYRVRADAIKRRDTSLSGSTAGVKDLGMVMAMAGSIGAALPIAALVQQYLTILVKPEAPTNGIVALATFLDRINPMLPREAACSREPGTRQTSTPNAE